MTKQTTSTDYHRLFDLVFNQGFRVPCCLNYAREDDEKPVTDFASVFKRGDSIIVGVRGLVYFSCEDWMINEQFPTIKSMFIHDCEKDNLAWFDTFTDNDE